MRGVFSKNRLDNSHLTILLCLYDPKFTSLDLNYEWDRLASAINVYG